MSASAGTPGVAGLPPVLARWWQHPGRTDVLLVLVLAALGLPQLFSGRESSWWAGTLHVLLLGPLLLRRRYPVAVFGVVAGVAFVQWLSGLMLFGDVSLLIALYTIAARWGWQASLPAVGVTEVGVVLASTRFVPAGRSVFASIVFLSGLVAAALFLGTTVRARAEIVANLEDRARRAEREIDQQAALAATAERARIAREMHDIIAHSLSVIIALADGAAAAQATDREEAGAAMRQVSVTGRQALAEMRRLLGVLRAPTAPGDPSDGPGGADQVAVGRAPQPTLSGLDALLDDVRATGLPVELTTTGAVPVLDPVLPEALETTIYRIVQEALTNVLKHARRPTGVQVALTWHQAGVDVDVVDDGQRASVARRGANLLAAQRATRGHGLRGMRERVLLYAGEFRAGPLPAGGWAVHARLHVGEGSGHVTAREADGAVAGSPEGGLG